MDIKLHLDCTSKVKISQYLHFFIVEKKEQIKEKRAFLTLHFNINKSINLILLLK